MSLSRREFHRKAFSAAGGLVTFCTVPQVLFAESAESDLQPLSAQVQRLANALASLGDPLPPAVMSALQNAYQSNDGANGVAAIQAALDSRVLMNVQINPESRVSISRGAAKARLVELGWRTFLIKVENQAGDTNALKIYCPQGRPTGRQSAQSITAPTDNYSGGPSPNHHNPKCYFA